MSWAKFSDDAHRSERILALSHAGYRLWSASIMDNRGYTVPGCVRGRSPFISKVRAEALARHQGVPMATITELDQAGRWEPTDGGWNIHDYGDFLPSQRDLQADHEPDPVKQAAGIKGAAKRWQRDSTYIGNGDGKPIAGRKQSDNPVARGPVPVPTPNPVTEILNTPPLPPAPEALELQTQLSRVLGITQPKGTDCLIAERMWLDFHRRYEGVADMVATVEADLERRQREGREPIHSLEGCRIPLRWTHDRRADEKPVQRSGGRVDSLAMERLGDVLSFPHEHTQEAP